MSHFDSISADSHVIEPPDLREKWLPKKFKDRAQRLEEDTKQTPALHTRVALLEAEAQEAARLRERVKELESHVQRAANSQAEMRQSATQWQQKYERERAARIKADRQWELGCANAQQRGQENQALKRTVAELEPLRVWAGHPCKVCKRPLSGVVSRENVVKAMKNFGHTDCLKKESGSGEALLAGLAGLYALLQIRKGS
jgi:hypothetical protein